MLNKDNIINDNNKGNKLLKNKFGNSNWNELKVNKNELSVIKNVNVNIAYYYNNFFRRIFLL